MLSPNRMICEIGGGTWSASHLRFFMPNCAIEGCGEPLGRLVSGREGVKNCSSMCSTRSSTQARPPPAPAHGAPVGGAFAASARQR